MLLVSCNLFASNLCDQNMTVDNTTFITDCIVTFSNTSVLVTCRLITVIVDNKVVSVSLSQTSHITHNITEMEKTVQSQLEQYKMLQDYNYM